MKALLFFLWLLAANVGLAQPVELSDDALSGEYAGGINLTILNSEASATQVLTDFNEAYQTLVAEAGFDPIPRNIDVTVSGARYIDGSTPITINPDGSTTYMLPDVDYLIFHNWLPGPSNPGTIAVYGIHPGHSTITITPRP